MTNTQEFGRRNIGGGGPADTGGQRPGAGGGSATLAWFKPAGLWPLAIFIFFLRIFTLGIYHFWGKSEVRRRIWSAVRLNGQPLEYTGTGMELFLGFLIVFFLVFVPLGLITAIPVFGALAFPLIFYLLGVGQYRARSYRLTRTNWRGIRGAMAGSSWAYGWTYIWTGLLILLTFGWITPWRNTMLYQRLTNESRFGDRPLAFSAPSGPLYKPYAVLWFGQIILFTAVILAIGLLYGQEAMLAQQAGTQLHWTSALGVLGIILAGFILWSVISASYKAAELNYFANNTTYENANFRLNATTGSLINLVVTNMLLAIFTLGIAIPVVQSRLAGYIVSRLGLDGDVDFAAIAQSQQAVGRTGEGLAEAFDVDAF